MISTYAIRDNETGLVKIGKSRNVYARQDALQCGNAHRLYLVWQCDKNVETALHHWFGNRKAVGEWFRLTDEDIDQLSYRAAQAYFLHAGWAGLCDEVRCYTYHKRSGLYKSTVRFGMEIVAASDEVARLSEATT